MRELLRRPVFRVRDETFSWVDVAVASAHWGDWERLREDARAGLACLLAYRDSGRPLPEADVDDAAVEFRYAHEMVSAQEAQEWFERWGITAGEWMEYIRRDVLRRKLEGRLPEMLERHPVAEDDVIAVSGIEAVCSGLFHRLAPKLAARAAVYERVRNTRENGGPVFDDDAVSRLAHTLPCTGLPISAQEERASARRIATLELALEEFRSGLVTPRAVAEQVSSHHLDWIRVEYETLEYPAEAMAREALLCVREDGMGFDELAADTGVAALREDRGWIGEITGPLRGALLGARPGDVVGPFASGRAYALHRLREKRLPSPDDEDVRRRAERSLLNRALASELQERVQWLVTL
jgi:hypothetical protein